MPLHVPAVPDSGRPIRAVPVTVGAPRFAGAFGPTSATRSLDVVGNDRERRRVARV